MTEPLAPEEAAIVVLLDNGAVLTRDRAGVTRLAVPGKGTWRVHPELAARLAGKGLVVEAGSGN